MGPLLAIVQLVMAAILLVVALAVRFAGAGRALNGVDYARVRDPVGLHRWAGGWLLLLPAGFLAGGLLSFREPQLALLLLGAAVVAAIIVAIRVMAGTGRFQAPP